MNASLDITVFWTIDSRLPYPFAALVVKGSPDFSYIEVADETANPAWLHLPMIRVPAKTRFVLQRFGNGDPDLDDGTNPPDFVVDRVRWTLSRNKVAVWDQPFLIEGDNPPHIQVGTIAIPIPIEPILFPAGSVVGIMAYPIQGNTGKLLAGLNTLYAGYRITGEFQNAH